MLLICSSCVIAAKMIAGMLETSGVNQVSLQISVHCKLEITTSASVQCTVYSVQCTEYSVQCSVQCTLYSVQCKLYSVHCTSHCMLYKSH